MKLNIIYAFIIKWIYIKIKKQRGSMWKKISKQNKQKQKQAVISKSIKNIDNEQKRQQINNEDVQQDNQLMEFMSQIYKSGIPVNQDENLDNRQLHQQQKERGVKHKQNIGSDLKKNIGTQNSILQNMAQFCELKSYEEIQLDYDKPQLSGNSKKQDKSNKMKNICVNYKLQIVRNVINTIRKQMMSIYQYIYRIRKQVQMQATLYMESIRQISLKKSSYYSYNSLTQNSLEQRIQQLQNVILQKQYKIQQMSFHIQNLTNENNQLNEKVFDLNQKVVQCQLQAQQKMRTIVKDIKKKMQTYTQVSKAHRDDVDQSVGSFHKFRNHRRQNSQQKQINFGQKYKSSHSKQKQLINNKLRLCYGDYRDAQNKQINEIRSMPTHQRYSINVQDVENNYIPQLQNNNEIISKINYIKHKYRINQPYTPKTQSNLNKDKSIFDMQTYKNNIHDRQEPITNYISPRNLNKDRMQHNLSSVVSDPYFLNNKSYKKQDIKRKKIEKTSQDFKIDKLGARIDELRLQIKKQINLTK